MDKDTVYREDAMNAIRETMTKLLRDNVINNRDHDKYFLYKESLVALKELPPAQQKQMCVAEIKIDEETFKKLVDNAVIRIFEQVESKKGHWISLDDFRGKYNENGYKCSECGEHSGYEENYCSYCGAMMVKQGEEHD